jgi:hypothetical protein
MGLNKEKKMKSEQAVLPNSCLEEEEGNAKEATDTVWLSFQVCIIKYCSNVYTSRCKGKGKGKGKVAPVL